MKSWSDQIRFFYATTFIMLTSMIWIIASSIIFNIEISFYLFIITLVSSSVARYLFKKGQKVSLCITIPMVPLVIYGISKGVTFLGCLNSIFIIFIIIKLLNEENENINYDRYKSVFVQGAYVLFIVSMAYALTSRSSSSDIYIGIVIYLVLIVVTLRESMWYCYNIKKSKSSKWFNSILIGFSILITQEFFYGKCVIILNAIYNGFNFIIEKVLGVVIVGVGYIVEWGINALQKLVGNNILDGDGVWVKEGNTAIDIKNIISGEGINPIFAFLAKSVVIVILLVLLIRLAKKIAKNNRSHNEMSYTEVVEFIEENNKSTNRFIKRIKKLFRKKGTPREEVIYKYGEFVERSKEKGIFEVYMTPKQLSNVVKIKIDSYEGIEELTAIYNESKFSTHIINCVQEQKVEETVDNINKKIK